MNILVYGIGAFYKANKSLLVPSCYNISAFISEDINNAEIIFEGKKIIKLEEIKNYKFDKIVIATEKWIAVEQKILSYGVEMEKIIIPLISKETCKTDMLEQKINNLKKKTNKPKLAVISYLSDKFVKRFENYFEVNYDVTFITLNLEQSRLYINQILKYADICFFEWAGSPLVLASYSSIAKTKPIIARIHRYEVYTNTIKSINWDCVDNIIFIADHIRNKFKRVVNIKNDKLSLIHSAFEIEKFTFKCHQKGYNIAYVGDLSYRKNIQLIMFIMKKLKSININYKLYLTGTFESQEYKDYIYHMIKELDINENVIFCGYVPDLNLWLDDKDYIICSSTSEGHISSIQEAMLKGIKPIIYNYEGAEEIYPKDYLWNELDEAVNLIVEEKYNSDEYKALIENGFNIDDKTKEICDLIDDVCKNYK